MEKDYKARNTLAKAVITQKLKEHKELTRSQLVDYVNAEFAKIGYEPMHPSTFDSIICSMVNNEICEKTQRAHYELLNKAVRQRFTISEKINEAIRLTENYLSNMVGLLTGYDYLLADKQETEAIESIKKAYINIGFASDDLSNAKEAIEKSINDSQTNETVFEFENEEDEVMDDEPYEDMEDDEGMEMGM